MEEKNILKKAEDLAVTLHTGQFRKDGTTPYIEHPKAVVQILKDCDVNDVETLSAAWLHDVLEDCNCNDKEKNHIRETIGDEAYLLITNLTHSNSENKYAKDFYLAKIATSQNLKLILIKCADRIHNTKSFIKDGNFKYAKKYFHKANGIYGALYNFKCNAIISAIKMFNKIEELDRYIDTITFKNIKTKDKYNDN